MAPRSSQGFQVCSCFSGLIEVKTVSFWLSISIVFAGESHEDVWGVDSTPGDFFLA